MYGVCSNSTGMANSKLGEKAAFLTLGYVTHQLQPMLGASAHNQNDSADLREHSELLLYLPPQEHVRSKTQHTGKLLVRVGTEIKTSQREETASTLDTISFCSSPTSTCDPHLTL